MQRSEDVATAYSLMQSTFCAEKDTFTPTAFPLQPLPFDRVCDGRPITSICTLFRLPIELHSNILNNLNAEDLANLALVDSDCQQLARSMQFAIVYLSISRQSMQLIQQILGEQYQQAQGGRNVRRIGPCVRRLVVASNSEHVKAVSVRRHLQEMDESDMHYIAEMHDALINITSSCQTVSKAFPNIELFQFADDVPMPAILCKALSRSRLRHLALDNFCIGEIHPSMGNILAHGVRGLSAWSNMQTLRVSFPKQFDVLNNTTQSMTRHLLKTMLRAVAPSIEGLMLGGMRRFFDHSDHSVSSLPEFPRLQRLHLEEYWRPGDDGSYFLRILLPLHGASRHSLKSLQLDRIDSVHLMQLGHLSRLTKLVINDYSLKDRLPNFAFLAANPQLELLSFTFPIRSRTLRHTLLPTIHASGFSSLRILRLTSASTHVSRRVLTAIGLISSLEMLWLSAGQQFGWKCDWFVDHTALRERLKGLHQLRELAFSRESYHCKQFRYSEQEEVRLAYYAYPVLPPDVSEANVLTIEDAQHLRASGSANEKELILQRSTYIWEKWHRGRILDLAEEYATLFPRLAFVYMGEYPIEVVREQASSQVQNIVPLSDRRDSCLTLLNSKWGSQTV